MSNVPGSYGPVARPPQIGQQQVVSNASNIIFTA